MPLIHPEIIKTFLAIPIEERENGKLYKILLKSVYEGLEKLPSTNDSSVPIKNKFFVNQSKRHLSKKVIMSYQSSISSCECTTPSSGCPSSIIAKGSASSSNILSFSS